MVAEAKWMVEFKWMNLVVKRCKAGSMQATNPCELSPLCRPNTASESVHLQQAQVSIICAA